MYVWYVFYEGRIVITELLTITYNISNSVCVCVLCGVCVGLYVCNTSIPFPYVTYDYYVITIGSLFNI